MAYVFSSIALLTSLITFFYIKAYVKRRTSIQRIPQETRDAVAQIVNEIDRITDRDSLLIEERVNKLKTILAEIDKRLLVLQKNTESQAPVVIRSMAKAEALTAQPPAAKIEAAAAPAGMTPAAQSPQAAPSSPPHDAPAAKPETVLQMAARGIPPSAIAVQLGKSVTEVEMEIFLGRRL